MTIHAFDVQTGQSLRWVAVPLELLDWMAAHFKGRFVAHLSTLDPYKDVRLPVELLQSAKTEIQEILEYLQGHDNANVPRNADQIGPYGREGATKSCKELIDLLSLTSNPGVKFVSVGD